MIVRSGGKSYFIEVDLEELKAIEDACRVAGGVCNSKIAVDGHGSERPGSELSTLPNPVIGALQKARGDFFFIARALSDARNA